MRILPFLYPLLEQVPIQMRLELSGRKHKDGWLPATRLAGYFGFGGWCARRALSDADAWIACVAADRESSFALRGENDRSENADRFPA